MMSSVVFSVLVALSAAAPARSNASPLLAELVEKGVAMPDGSAIPLAAPTMPDGLTPAAQEKAIAAAKPAGATLAQFTMKSSTAPVNVRIRTLKGQDGATYRAVDLWFVAHGDWDTLLSEKFGNSLTQKQAAKPAGGADQPGVLVRSGFLTDAEMQTRGLATKGAKAGQEDRFFYTTFTLFDRVEISATRYAVLTRTPTSIVLTTKVDPRFAKDAEYPNEWRSIERDAAAKLVFGPKQSYRGAGFYVKITRLSQPAGTIFVEYHSVFHEPKGWFDGENLLRAKLPTIAQFQVQQFRGKWAKASLEKSGGGAKTRP